MEQQIQFLTCPHGARIAYSTIGAGPPLVRTPPWLSHLGSEWEFPAARSFYEALARDHTLIRYDSLGCGLSDWNREDFSLSSEVSLLEHVVDTLDLAQFAVFGYDAGVRIAIAYAARHPERVSHLLLFLAAEPQFHLTSHRELPQALELLMKEKWSLATRLLASLYAPECDSKEVHRLATLCRASTSGHNAVRAVHGLFSDNSVPALPEILRVPTTVIVRIGHRPLFRRAAIALGSQIPSARFVSLTGRSPLPYLEDRNSVVTAISQALVSDSVDSATERAENLTSQKVFRRIGDYWSIAHENRSFAIADSLGMRYLAVLLGRPWREIPVNELELLIGAENAFVSEGYDSSVVSSAHFGPDALSSGHAGNLGKMLDSRAKREYRGRLNELRAQLEAAKADGDHDRASQAERELSFLTRELRRAIGLGGRDRFVASAIERSRINVTRAIRRAIEKIRQHDPALGEMLSLRVKTGATCVYLPASEDEIEWKL